MKNLLIVILSLFILTSCYQEPPPPPIPNCEKYQEGDLRIINVEYEWAGRLKGEIEWVNGGVSFLSVNSTALYEDVEAGEHYIFAFWNVYDGDDWWYVWNEGYFDTSVCSTTELRVEGVYAELDNRIMKTNSNFEIINSGRIKVDDVEDIYNLKIK